MAADIDLKSYNETSQALLMPFDESEISEREGSGNQTFSYVPPERYRYRLLNVFAEGYKFSVTVTEIRPTGVAGSAHFVGSVMETGVAYDIVIPVFEPWTFKSGTKDILNPDQTFSKLASAGIKACAREMGLGLHLYDKAAKKTSSGSSSSKPAASKAKAAPAGTGDGEGIPNFDADWDGTENVTFGTKYKSKPWTECDDDYLDFITSDPDKANKKALKEIARRQSIAGSAGNEQASKSLAAKAETAEDDDDFKF